MATLAMQSCVMGGLATQPTVSGHHLIAFDITQHCSMGQVSAGAILSPQKMVPASCVFYFTDKSPSTVPAFPTSPVPHYSYTRDVSFRTLVSKFENGAEQRRQRWSQGKVQITLNYKFLTPTEFDILWNYYVARKGSYESFKFTDLRSGTVYNMKFVEDSLSLEEFAKNLGRVGLKLMQVFE